MEDPSASEFLIAFIGIIPNENYSGLDDFGRTDFLRIYDRAKKNKVIKSITSEELEFQTCVLEVLQNSIRVTERLSKNCCFEASIPLIFSCGSLSEDGLNLFTFNCAPYQANQSYRDLLVVALPDENAAEKLSEELNAKFARFAEQQLQTASRQSKSLSSLEASSPYVNLDTPRTDSSHQSSDVSKAINEVLTCLRPEEVPNFREIINKYSNHQQNVKVFAQKLVELLGPNRKKRLSYQDASRSSGDVAVVNFAVSKNKMSSVSRPSSGNSAAGGGSGGGGGGGIRGFFSKLRKPSDQLIGSQQVQVGSRTFEAHELQKLIPQLEEAISRKDAQLRQQQTIVEGHIKRISELEGEVTTLQRECDKLRSVLEQKAQSAASPGQPPSPSPRTDQLGTDLQQKAVLPADGAQRAKKIAVSAEPTNFENKPATLQHYNKTVGAKQMIRDAVQKNDFLKQLAKEQIIELVNCMYEMRARAGQWVIQEGEPGDRLFVVAEGELQVSREGALLGKMRAGTVMGELAILYNCTSSEFGTPCRTTQIPSSRAVI